MRTHIRLDCNRAEHKRGSIEVHSWVVLAPSGPNDSQPGTDASQLVTAPCVNRQAVREVREGPPAVAETAVRGDVDDAQA